MPDPIVFPTAWAQRLARTVAAPAPAPARRSTSARRPPSPTRPTTPAPGTGCVSVGCDLHLPAQTVVVIPILTASAATQTRGAFALLADPATRLHGLFIASGTTWTCWRRDDSVPVPVEGMTAVSGPAMPAVLAQAIADGSRIVTGNAVLLSGLLARLNWPALPQVCELCAVLRSLNMPADSVGMAVHLLHQQIAPVRVALADHRWRAETMDTQGLGPAVEHAWLTARIAAQVAADLDLLLGYEAAAWRVHEQINRHGTLVDRVLSDRCAVLARHLRKVLIAKAQPYVQPRLTVKLLGDLARVQAMLAPLGVQISNLSVPSLEMTLTRLPKTLPQRTAAQWLLAAVIVCRQAEGGRFVTLASHAGAQDHILRGAFVFCGAHPGRWTSEGAQLQNMKRSTLPPGIAEQIITAIHTGSTKTPAAALALAEQVVAIAGPDHAHACLSSLLRLCFQARTGTCFAIADLALIELRVLNWLAGDEHVLAKLADPAHDAHTATAEAIWQEVLAKDHVEYDLRRNLVAKKVNHGFGFGLSAAKAEEKARDEWGIDLAALRLSGAHLRAVYHRRFPRVQRLWSNLIAGAVQALKTDGGVQVGPVCFRRCRFGLAAVLPSGRVMVYANARVERDQFGQEIIVYTKFGDNGTLEERKLWGSKLAQHLCEAIGRDLLVGMMTAILAAGYAIALHAHDELVIEVPETNAEEHLAVVVRIMSTTPQWAAGLPLAAEGHLSRRFSKKALFMD
jgi:hypothetical protein